MPLSMLGNALWGYASDKLWEKMKDSKAGKLTSEIAKGRLRKASEKHGTDKAPDSGDHEIAQMFKQKWVTYNGRHFLVPDKD